MVEGCKPDVSTFGLVHSVMIAEVRVDPNRYPH